VIAARFRPIPGDGVALLALAVERPKPRAPRYTLVHAGGPHWRCEACDVFILAECGCCEPPACSGCGGRSKVGH
jgi:hypothetical protein